MSVLRDIQANGDNPSSVVLKKTIPDSYELHYSPTVVELEALKQIAHRYNLKTRIETGKIIVF